jgi:Fic family protein
VPRTLSMVSRRFQRSAWSRHPGREDERVAFALIKAIVAHVYIAWIHPFGDGNGRTARLVEVQILNHAGVPIVATNLLSDHYNRTRDRYHRELRQASQQGGNLNSFVSYAVEGFVDGLRTQVATIRKHQLASAWKDLVHETLEGTTDATKRRRDLVLDMPLGEVVARNKLTTISPRVAGAYGRADERTLPRDLNQLVKFGLIEKVRGGYQIAIWQVAAAYYSPTFNHETLRPF